MKYMSCCHPKNQPLNEFHLQTQHNSDVPNCNGNILPMANYNPINVKNPLNHILDEAQVMSMNTASSPINSLNVTDIVSVNAMSRPNSVATLNAQNLIQHLLLQSKGYLNVNK